VNSGDMVQKKKKKEKKAKGKGKGKGWLFLCCKARYCYYVVTQLQQKQPQAALEKEKGKGKGKGWLFLCCKARYCLLCCNTVATKAAPSCFGEGEGEGEGEGKGLIIPLLQGAPLFTVL